MKRALEYGLLFLLCGCANRRSEAALPEASTGRLEPEVIQRVVRSNYGGFRACYERGLASDTTLAGRVTVRFVISEDGEVTSAVLSESTLADERVVDCILAHYETLSFPEPDGGIVTVFYPIQFSAK